MYPPSQVGDGPLPDELLEELGLPVHVVSGLPQHGAHGQLVEVVQRHPLLGEVVAEACQAHLVTQQAGQVQCRYPHGGHILVLSPEAGFGWRVLQEVQSHLPDDERVQESESVPLQRDMIRNLLPEEEPVPQRHGELSDHGRDPADVHTFIHHRYKQSVWVCVYPVERGAFWVTHPDAGPIPHVNTELSQRATVQPDNGVKAVDECPQLQASENASISHDHTALTFL